MTNTTPDKVRKFYHIYSILLSICLIVAGLCLILACISIYRSGEQPFSRASVSDAFKNIAIPVYLCLILTIIGIVIDIIYRVPLDKIKPSPDYEHILKKLQQKRDLSVFDEKFLLDIESIKRKRILIRRINISIAIICSIIFLIYSTNSNNFHQTDINGSMIKAMYVLIPCLIITFGFTIFSLYYSEKCIKVELELTRQAPSKETDSNKKDNISTKLPVVKYIVLALGVALLIFGFMTGGTADVLTKAVNICTECIGLG